MQIIQATEAAKVGRRWRRPKHSFQLRHRPMQIQPFLLAPVLPGETLKNALLQARAVTSPLKNPLIGWWLEYYIFYVPHRAMPGSETFQNMVLQPGASMAAVEVAAANTAFYKGTQSIDWVAQCLQPVVEEYFRDPSETWNANVIDSIPVAKVQQDSWLDSVIDETLLPEGSDPQTTPDNMEDLERMRWQYDLLRDMKMVDMSYEDWIATHGVVQNAAVGSTKPELLRYVKEWTYPSNTIDPTTGAPTSACSWAIAERADKDRFFKEPGFIFGVTIARPKLYFSKQTCAAAMMLSDVFSWLPAMLRNEPGASLKEFLGGASGNGPLGQNPTNGYWVDVADLYHYGDQFLNFVTSTTDAGLVALPTATMQKRYISSTDADGLFAGVAPANIVNQDGACQLQILTATPADRT